jgi:rhamnogalacturonan endolyase
MHARLCLRSARAGLTLWSGSLAIVVSLLTAPTDAAPRQLENLTRGVVAVPRASGEVLVSWRLFGNDPPDLAFNLYRDNGADSPALVNEAPLDGATCYIDHPPQINPSLAYFVRPVVDGRELAPSKSALVWGPGYLEIPLKKVEGYRPGDASVADLDGDGELEIVLQQESRPRDNGSAGLTGQVLLDAYKLDGTFLWRIDLGQNIREGEHYTQFMVYDLDGDGCAEIACKTADGTVDGTGRVLGDASRDWRTLAEGSLRHGRILDGPEYLTIFAGTTGAALETVPYIPTRDPIDGWGGIGGNAGNDSYGNRCDRFLACVAYLDGERPSLVMCRGVYGRTVLAAWDWRDHKLTSRWVFDTGSSMPPFADASPFAGMGGHSLSVGDVDDDGRDEIVYQAMVVDDDGTGLYSTGLRHGDSMHLADMDPQRPGMEVFTIQENETHAELFQTPGAAMRDARTGEILWSHSPTVDVAAGLACDIDPRHLGYEAWGGPGGLRNVKGEQIGKAPRETSWCVWWDGDLLRELLSAGRPAWRPRRDRRERAEPRGRLEGAAESERPERLEGSDRPESPRGPGNSERVDVPERGDVPERPRVPREFPARPTRVLKWNWDQQSEEPLCELDGYGVGRGPVLVGDLIGDWREEVLLVAPSFLPTACLFVLSRAATVLVLVLVLETIVAPGGC